MHINHFLIKGFIGFWFIIGVMSFTGIYETGAKPPCDISFSSKTLPQGDLASVRVEVEKGGVPRIIWRNREVLLVPGKKKGVWYGFLGADLAAEPGVYRVLIKIRPSGYEKQERLRITKGDYGVRSLTLPKKMVDLDADTLKRVKKESEKMKSLWAAPPSEPLWEGLFLRPVSGKVVGSFGRRSIINDQPRSPHSGVDLRSARGTPIKAINNGRVLLTADYFFTGRSVVIDHGGGIRSMYFHMDKILVEKEQIVKKGEVIGHVGSSGRATGPHLHWGVRINGARVDPMRLMDLSRQLIE